MVKEVGRIHLLWTMDVFIRFYRYPSNSYVPVVLSVNYSLKAKLYLWEASINQSVISKKTGWFVKSLSPSTDILSRDLPHWRHCQGHRYHCDISSSDCSGHSEGKYYDIKDVTLFVYCSMVSQPLIFNIV